MNVVPAILPYNFEEIIEKISRVEGLMNSVQIDLCDGVFGREKTWIPAGDETLPGGFSYEFDIMVNEWRPLVIRALALGASRIVAHVDQFSDADMQELVSYVAPSGIPLGISVSNDKTIDFHAEKIRRAQELYPSIYIQVMGIKKIGEQGQFFDESAVERVRMLKQQFGSLSIQVDGGIKPGNVARIVDAGTETLIVGSYLFGAEDPGVALKNLEASVRDPMF